MRVRTVALLVIGWTACDGWPPSCRVVFARRGVGIRRPLGLVVVHGVVAHGCAAGVLGLGGVFTRSGRIKRRVTARFAMDKWAVEQ